MKKLPKLEFPIRLDLGAGQYPKDGFIRMDIDPNGADIIWDANHGIPLPDNSVCELYTSHFLEHFTRQQIYPILNEIFRVCEPNAKVEIKVPHGSLPEGELPCHYTLITETTLRAWDQFMPHKDPNHFELLEIKREDIHLTGIYKIVKNNP